MIYSRRMINCDVYIKDVSNGIQILAIGQDAIVVETKEKAVDKLLEMKDNGVQIPDYVFIKLRS